MMSRTQITLDAEAHRRARQRADRLGISLAAYIRMIVQRDLDGHVPGGADVEGIIGVGDTGDSDVAESKDRYILDAITSAHPARGSGAG